MRCPARVGRDAFKRINAVVQPHHVARVHAVRRAGVPGVHIVHPVKCAVPRHKGFAGAVFFCRGAKVNYRAAFAGLF
ncbi:hypothetical protein SDC9_209595 [bioreactor metagenome]|uniref:Uncharacterized protein n=1 Tax=bioreactor metagenome TaxID=1076179 RepID=A0A645JFI2_9ZZZZ